MTFENTDFRQELLNPENPLDVKFLNTFLKSVGFDYKKEDVDTTMIIYNLNHEIIGTGSLKENVLKYVVVAPDFRETSAFPQIVTYLANKALENHKQCFVYTKPETAKLFQALGYSLIATAEPLFAVLEFGYESIKDYQHHLLLNKIKTSTNNIAAVVVNCNPFTIGHRYLIEKASQENEIVYLFVVSENLSAFPFEIRWKLIEDGIAHLKNVKMIATGPYMISGAIFPNYFLKNESWNFVSQKQAEMDVKIFADYIAPILEIKKRYVGSEKYCKTTAAYNAAMHKILPEHGIKVIEYERISAEINDKKNYVSASKVREAIRHDKLYEVISLLPKNTKEFLLSEKSAKIRLKIIQGSSRH
jgi:[citrate (pro-3S)-lyase] ligase